MKGRLSTSSYKDNQLRAGFPRAASIRKIERKNPPPKFEAWKRKLQT